MAKAVGEFPGMGEAAARFGEIEELMAEVEKHILAIQDLYARIARAAGGNDGRAGRKGSPAAGATRRGGKKRAKRGALRDALHQVLAGGKAMGPAEIVAALHDEIVGFCHGQPLADDVTIVVVKVV